MRYRSLFIFITAFLIIALPNKFSFINKVYGSDRNVLTTEEIGQDKALLKRVAQDIITRANINEVQDLLRMKHSHAAIEVWRQYNKGTLPQNGPLWNSNNVLREALILFGNRSNVRKTLGKKFLTFLEDDAITNIQDIMLEAVSHSENIVLEKASGSGGYVIKITYEFHHPLGVLYEKTNSDSSSNAKKPVIEKRGEKKVLEIVVDAQPYINALLINSNVAFNTLRAGIKTVQLLQ